MDRDPWLPIGHLLPDGSKVRGVLHVGANWQIMETAGRGRALIATAELAARWIEVGLIGQGALAAFSFGRQAYRFLTSGPSSNLVPVDDCRSPSTKNEALAFAIALKATRAIDADSPLQDSIYVESASRLLPTYSISQRTPDDVVLGLWLTGGASVSAKSFRRLSQMLSWMVPAQVRGVVEAAGMTVKDTHSVAAGLNDRAINLPEGASGESRLAGETPFELPGRPDVEAFLNEHVIDIIRYSDRYKALGIDFPAAIVFHGPPGCGKTFAVDKLIEFLAWPSFQIDASSVASPFIHETSRKVAEVFDRAMENSPSVLVIDEMEAFLADRDIGAGSSHHRIEEMAEFLRRIPEAARNHVLVVAMTNRVDMIDPAILRRGRFDHIIKMDYATEGEVCSLLEMLLSSIPKEGEIDCASFAKKLAGRPLSDVAFVVREGSRLAARAGRSALDANSLASALRATTPRTGDDKPTIGFHMGRA